MEPSDLKDLYQRKIRAMARRPGFAAGGGHACVRPVGGCRYEVIHGDRTQVSDLPVEDGGAGSAPHPGQLMRASIGACLAMGYQLWAARLDVPLARVEVEMSCEYDARGQLGVSDDVPVGWKRIQVAVTIESSAPAEEVKRLVDHANRLSPMLANLSREIEQVHHLTVLPPA